MVTRSTKTAQTTAPLATFARDFHKQADLIAGNGVKASEELLAWAITQARTPFFNKMTEAKFDQLVKPISDAVIAKLPLSASTRPTYRAYFKTCFLATSHGIATDKNGLRLMAEDLKPKCLKLGVIAKSNRGAPKKGPAGNAPDAKAPTTPQDKAPTTPPKSKVLTDAQYDAAIAAFVTALGLTGSNVTNVRQAFSPSDIDQTLRLLASTYG